ncbi:hypothetical protein Q3G72_010890 [Acer saccharum]|nr:hypothetical protein Q3G72_010890 [Acer saccharum]
MRSLGISRLGVVSRPGEFRAHIIWESFVLISSGSFYSYHMGELLLISSWSFCFLFLSSRRASCSYHLGALCSISPGRAAHIIWELRAPYHMGAS